MQGWLTSYQRKIAAVLLLLVVWPSANSDATVLEQLSFEQLVAQSPVIFRGTVTNWRIETIDGLQHTWVRFRIEEAVKGSSEPTLELRFLGADLRGNPLHVEGQFIPTPGTRGVFFVADVSNDMVNPLTGWIQGYFPLMQDASGDDYLDMRERRDLAVPGLEVDPLVEKMLTLGFDSDAIDQKVTRAFLFSWDDFRSAIATEISANGSQP